MLPAIELYIVSRKDRVDGVILSVYDSSEVKIKGICVSLLYPFGFSFVLPKRLFSFK